MMFNKKFIRNNIIAFVIFGLLLGLIGFPGVGLAACLIAFIDLLAGLISLLIGQKTNGLTLLLCSGVLFLIGFSICSTVPLSFH